MTLRRLSEATGLSEGYLSRVENFRAAISLANLERLARAFGVEVAAFFENRPPESPLVLCRRGQGRRMRFRGRQGLRVELPADSKKGKLMEPLVGYPNTMKAFTGMQSHSGEEFIYIAEGRCEFRFGKEIYALERGDSVYFESDYDHAIVPIEGESCVFVAVATSRDYKFHGSISRLLEE